MAQAQQLLFLALANLGDEPGIEVTPQRLADGGFRLLIQSSRLEGAKSQIRGRERLEAQRLAAPDVLHCERWEWVEAMRAAGRQLAERAQTAEHTTPNLPQPSRFEVRGGGVARIAGDRLYGSLAGDGVSRVPNSRLPPPMLHLMPSFRPDAVPERVEGEQAKPHRAPELVLVAGVDGLPVAVLPREGSA